MARQKVEINPICGQRLKQICQEQGITQKQLHEKIHLSQQAISAIVKGKASLTGDIANKVIEVFPQYRIEWLLGYDDMPTEEYAKSFEKMMLLRDRLMDEAYNQEIVATLLKMIDIEARYEKVDISIEEPWKYPKMHEQGLISDEEWEGWTHGGNQSEHMKALAAEHSDYVVTINGESFNIPVRDFFLLADDVEQYGLFRLREYIKNKKRRYY